VIMFDFIVLITSHRWQDEHTNQFKLRTAADDIPGAREVARLLYPSVYLRVFDKGRYLGRIAYFTGQIFQI
jgi:hypothetical protein